MEDAGEHQAELEDVEVGRPQQAQAEGVLGQAAPPQQNAPKTPWFRFDQDSRQVLCRVSKTAWVASPIYVFSVGGRVVEIYFLVYAVFLVISGCLSWCLDLIYSVLLKSAYQDGEHLSSIGETFVLLTATLFAMFVTFIGTCCFVSILLYRIAIAASWTQFDRLSEVSGWRISLSHGFFALFRSAFVETMIYATGFLCFIVALIVTAYEEVGSWTIIVFLGITFTITALHYLCLLISWYSELVRFLWNPKQMANLPSFLCFSEWGIALRTSLYFALILFPTILILCKQSSSTVHWTTLIVLIIAAVVLLCLLILVLLFFACFSTDQQRKAKQIFFWTWIVMALIAIVVGLILCGLVRLWLLLTTFLFLFCSGFGMINDPLAFQPENELIYTPEDRRNKATMLPEAGLISFDRYNFNIVLILILILFFGSVMALGTNLGQHATKPGVVSGSTSPSQQPYQICYENWNGLGITDMAFFTKLAYQDSTMQQQELNSWFGPNTWTVVAQSRKASPSFFDAWNNATSMSVIVVRGTVFSSGDWIQNADIWQASALLQAGDLLGPGLSLWPLKLVRYLVQGLSAMEVLSDRGPNSHYFTPIEEYIKSIKLNRSAILVTGHSLGGGLANIVGARMKLRSVGISAPGIMFAGGKLGLSESVIRAWNSNVQPAKDVVPKIDMQGGLNQLIDCSLSVGTCHSSSVTLCRLIESCGQADNKTLSCCSDNYCAKAG